MASEMFWKNQVDVSITLFTYIHHILAVDEFVAIAFVYSTVACSISLRNNAKPCSLRRRNFFTNSTTGAGGVENNLT